MLEVPVFSDTPHICRQDFPGVLSVPLIYVRTSNNESASVRQVTDVQRMIEQAIRNRRDAMMIAVRSAMFGASTLHRSNDRELFQRQCQETLGTATRENPFRVQGFDDGYFVTCTFPGHFDEARFAPLSLRAAAEAASINYRGWPFLILDANFQKTAYVAEGLRTLTTWTDSGGYRRYDYWLLRSSGLLLQRRIFWEDAAGRRSAAGNKVLDPNAIIFYVAESIQCMTTLYDTLGVTDEEITWNVQLTGVQGRALESADPLRSVMPYFISQSPTIEVTATHSLEEWRAATVDFAVAALEHLFLQFQWENPSREMIRDWITRLFKRRLYPRARLLHQAQATPLPPSPVLQFIEGGIGSPLVCAYACIGRGWAGGRWVWSWLPVRRRLCLKCKTIRLSSRPARGIAALPSREVGPREMRQTQRGGAESQASSVGGVT